MASTKSKQDALIDELLQDCPDPKDILGKNGLLKQLTKRLKQPAVELLSVDVDVMPLVISLCALRDVDGSYDEKLGLFQNLLRKPTSQAGKHALSIRCKEAAAAPPSTRSESG